MKNHTLIVSASLALCAAAFPISATADVVATGEGISWFGYRSNTTKTTFTYNADTKTTEMTNLDSDSYVWGYLENGIALDVGQTLTVSGTATFSSVSTSSSFLFGIYNSGANTKPTDSATSFSSIVAGTYDMTGFFAGTTQKSSTVTTTTYSRFKGKAADADGKGGAGFMTTNQGKDYIASETPATALAHPTASTAYDFSLYVSRTEAGYTVAVGDPENAVTFASDKSTTATTFDVIGLKSVGSGLSLSNLSFSTAATSAVPEPSTFGLLAGVFALALAVASRRRRK